MTRHLQRELDRLVRKLIRLCARVDMSLSRAVSSLGKNNASVATRLKEIDLVVDAREIEVEEECLKILALHQPVANDLRFVVAALKINNDLERIGDLAVNIAERACELSAKDLEDIPHEIPTMASRVQAMVKNSLKSLVNMDVDLARHVLASDDEVDNAHRSTFEHVTSTIQRDPTRAAQWIKVLSISRYLERIADHATNIAEDVIYMIEGNIVRHEAKGHKRAVKEKR